MLSDEGKFIPEDVARQEEEKTVENKAAQYISLAEGRKFFRWAEEDIGLINENENEDQIIGPDYNKIRTKGILNARLAESEFDCNETAYAKKHLETALRIIPKMDSNSAYQAALYAMEVAYKIYGYEKVVQIAKMIKDSPDDLQKSSTGMVNLKLIKFQVLEDRVEEARETLNLISEEFPYRGGAISSVAEGLAKNGKEEESKKFFFEAKRFADKLESSELRGIQLSEVALSQAKVGFQEDALATIDKIIKIRKMEVGEVYRKLFKYFAENEDLDNLEFYFNTLPDYIGKGYVAQDYLDLLVKKNEDYKIDKFLKSIIDQKEIFYAYNYLIELEIRNNKHTLAKKHLEEIVEREDGRPTVNFGNFYAMLGDFESAVSTFNQLKQEDIRAEELVRLKCFIAVEKYNHGFPEDGKLLLTETKEYMGELFEGSSLSEYNKSQISKILAESYAACGMLAETTELIQAKNGLNNENIHIEIAKLVLKKNKNEEIYLEDIRSDVFKEGEINKELLEAIVISEDKETINEIIAQAPDNQKKLVESLVRETALKYGSQYLDSKELIKLVESNAYPTLLSIEKFNNLDKTDALALIDLGYRDLVAYWPEYFSGLDDEVAFKIFENNSDNSHEVNLALVTNLNKFSLENSSAVFIKSLEAKDYHLAFTITNFLWQWSDLSSEVALKLITSSDIRGNKTNIGKKILDHLDSFEKLNEEVALELIDCGNTRNILEKKEHFDIDRTTLVDRTIKAGYGLYILENLDQFSDFNQNNLIIKFVEAGASKDVANSRWPFENITFEVGLKLAEQGHGVYVAKNQEKFADIDYYELAKKMYETGQSNQLNASVELFKGEWLKNAEYYKLLPSEYIALESVLAEKKDTKLTDEAVVEMTSGLEVRGCWEDFQNVIDPFEEGEYIFGAKKMFEYMYRPKLSRHDALHAFQSVIKLYEFSGLTPNQFYSGILQQVSMDNSHYNEGTAHHLLNSIAQTLKLDQQKIDEIKAQALEFQTIPELAGLVDYMTDTQKIFSSWDNLKRFSELVQLLDRSDILKELVDLAKEAESDPKKEKLYKYISTIAWHKTSKVNMEAVIEFWRRPGKFLDHADSHTPEKIHAHKKPSNYVEIPHMDLTAEELRDALVCGDMDRIQAFPGTLTIEYSLAEKQEIDETLDIKARLKSAIGSRRDGTANPTLFNAVAQYFKQRGKELNVTVQGYLSGDPLPLNEQDQAEQVLAELIDRFPNHSIKKQEPDKKYYRAQIHSKSDPEAVLAGNDTACCMPFGSGKNNVYTFNPNCALFAIQEKTGDNWRTIAQSVLTMDRDVEKSIPSIVEQMETPGVSITQVLPDSILTMKKAKPACDNIEVSPNAIDKEAVIDKIYADFFSVYLEWYNKNATGDQDFRPILDEEEVIIGTGYTDTLTELPKIKNTFAPLAPVGYSDKTGPQVYTLNLQEQRSPEILLSKESVNFTEAPSTHELTSITDPNIKPLTYLDSLPVAYLEGKAYSDNQSLMTYLHNMENGLIAKDINNESKNRPNLSLKYVDDERKIRGYMLAYEGREDGKPVIYISDLASDKESRMAGGKLIQTFIELYNESYLTKGKNVPLLLEARESTSYKIITRQIEKIGSKYGIKFEIEELETYLEGSDVMHRLLITPEKIEYI